jgi:glycine dehydrogenase subunit 1
MKYIPNHEAVRKEMLQEIGVDSVGELIKTIPESLQLKSPLNLPPALHETALLKDLKNKAKFASRDAISFLGGGSYRRFIPSAIAPVVSRAEFLTSYTPYQPEVSQGTLQVMFEFQTLLSQLTGMDVVNASMYEGASAAAEAVLMAKRINSKKKKVILSKGLHPEYRETVLTYLQHSGLEVEDVELDAAGQTDITALQSMVADDTLCVVTQMVNFFGVIEPMPQISEILSSQKTLNIGVLPEMTALGIIKSPGELGVDIFVGEGQSLGLPVSYGGPNLGIFATSTKYMRQLPGRLAGQTVDNDGKRAFCLTLATREQHIRREKATSNICSNQMLCALMVTMYLSLLGKNGLRKLALQNISKTEFLKKSLAMETDFKIRHSGSTYNEFVLELPVDSTSFLAALKAKNILGGIALKRFIEDDQKAVLISVTEMNSRDDLNSLLNAVREVR